MENPTMPLILSRPRSAADFADWPIGQGQTAPCRFWIETDHCGHEKVCRQIGIAAIRQTGYYQKCAIADGSDGRIYVIAKLCKSKVIVLIPDLRNKIQRIWVRADREPETYWKLNFFLTKRNRENAELLF